MAEVQTAAGRRVRYDDQGTGPPVLLLMGAYCGRGLWAGTPQALAPRHRVLTMDNRDAGESDPESAPYTMDDVADDAVALLSTLGIARAHVVGQSMGGMIATHVAANHPERVGRLVLIATPAPDPVRGARPLAPPPPSWADDPTERLRRVLPELGGPAFRAALTDERLAAIAELDAGNRIDLDGAQRQRHAMDSYHRLARFREVRAPTLVVHGALDHPEGAETLAGGIPGARLLLLPETGHLVPLERPEEVHRALLDFLVPSP